MSEPMVARTRTGIDGFFGQVLSGLGEGLERIGSDVLPNWTAQQLAGQSIDTMKDSTFEADPAQKRVDATTQAAVEFDGGIIKRIGDFHLFELGGISITGGSLIIGAAVFLGSLYVLKKFS